eukprot:TRINITY_DN16838_c0_g1_i2.p1 TRINITY_DN16838_c0_g1~~TRINITY_DN16838_c0_g1_i2.p1  ORF type:complete len:211 (-),score=33.60 TRINITY_DN16838_c0_g1_i2:158-790(-)
MCIRDRLGVDPAAASKQPVFVLLKKGQKLNEAETLETTSHEEFQAWMWTQLAVVVKFVNRHRNPVEMWWINGQRAVQKGVLGVGEEFHHTVHLSHEFWAVDTTVKDVKRSRLFRKSSVVAIWKAEQPGMQHLTIQDRECMDYDQSCNYWAKRFDRRTGRPECENNAGFMKIQCPFSCGQCNTTWRDADWAPAMLESTNPEKGSQNGHTEL